MALSSGCKVEKVGDGILCTLNDNGGILWLGSVAFAVSFANAILRTALLGTDVLDHFVVEIADDYRPGDDGTGEPPC